MIETAGITSFYKLYEPELTQNTVNWRIYNLVQKGLLKRIGRGKFKIGEASNYLPVITSEILLLSKELKSAFPYLKFSIWHTSMLNEFMLHQPSKHNFIVEVESEATEAVFYKLKELDYSVFIDPTLEILDRYLPPNVDSLIVKSLVSEAPLQLLNDIESPTIEKLLVDIFCDEVIFSAQQGSEMKFIFQNAFEKYTINRSRMYRYAARRGKKDKLHDCVESVFNSTTEID